MAHGASIAQDEDVDIYGQKHPHETSRMIRQKLKEFDATVRDRTATVTEENESLIQAVEKCPHLLTKSFKLMFLRTELFDVDKAVTRYCKYWTKRVFMFGETKAFQPLTLEKALVDDHVALEVGYIRLLPGVTDPKGRSILIADPSVLDKSKYTRESMCRAIWYVIHAALELETAQKHGVIVISDPSKAKFCHMDRKLLKMLLPSILGVMPMRTSAYHVCNAPTVVASVAYPFIKPFLPDGLRKRVFFHSGAEAKLLDQLKMYGLEKNAIPTQIGGRFEINHMKWLDQRRVDEL